MKRRLRQFVLKMWSAFLFVLDCAEVISEDRTSRGAGTSSNEFSKAPYYRRENPHIVVYIHHKFQSSGRAAWNALKKISPQKKKTAKRKRGNLTDLYVFV